MDTQLHYFHPSWLEPSDHAASVDICVYGGTAAGVVAAITATELGHSVCLLHPGLVPGGMTTGGLGWTDYGKKHVIGGRSRAFYRAVGQLVGLEEEWHFAPSMARQVLHQWRQKAGFTLRTGSYLERVVMDGLRIQQLFCLGGFSVRARTFIDATYEGDLMAAAGVSHAIGREANSVHGESLNGIQVRNYHQFSHPIDPWKIPGRPDSGLLPWIEATDLTRHIGEGDRRLQAYNFRVCLTDDPALRIPWEKPENFRDEEYELARRWFQSPKDRYNEHLRGPDSVPAKFDILSQRTPGGFHKTDTNNHGPVSSDFIGANHRWPAATYEERERIFQAHVAYQKGFYWVMANDPAIPETYRRAYARWGLPRDEFVETGHWPHQLYVREARRLVGDYVITERDCMGTSRPDDPVGMGSYQLDSHNCTRFVQEGRVLNEGDVQVPPTAPYPISYRCLIPRRGECTNLFIPVCLSASHIAYGSARMEPVFMVLGESSALAASLAIRQNRAVQDVPYGDLRPLLETHQQVLG